MITLHLRHFVWNRRFGKWAHGGEKITSHDDRRSGLAWAACSDVLCDPTALTDCGLMTARGRLGIYLGAATGVGTPNEMLWEGHRRADQGRQTIVLAALELDGIGEDEPPWPAFIGADNSGVSAPRRRAEFAFPAATAQH